MQTNILLPEKANISNNHFASQCTPVNSSSLNFKYKSDERLTSIEINKDDTLLVMKNFKVNKAHEWDNVS